MPPSPGKRNSSIPCPLWWRELAEARRIERGLSQKQLIALCGWPEQAGSSKMSRALRGEVTTIETVETIARALGIPRPFVTFDNEEDALLVEGQLAVRKGLRDLKK